jgi:hypothetical protein
VIAVAMDRRRESHSRRAHALRGRRRGRPFRDAGVGFGAGRRGVFFGRDAARRQQREPGGNDQRAARAGEFSAERLNGALVDGATLYELREIVNKGGVDHAVRHGGAVAQAFQVVKIASLDLGASRGERLGALIRAGEADHLMASVDELPNDARADKARSARDEDTHWNLLVSFSWAACAAP